MRRWSYLWLTGVVFMSVVGVGQNTKPKSNKAKNPPPAQQVKPVANTVATPVLSAWDSELLRELNAVRANPPQAVTLLLEFRKYFQGNELHLPKTTPIVTNEGLAAVDEAISFLKTAPALPPLQASTAISLAAQDHLKDILATGLSGHRGSDSSLPPQRVQKRGVNTYNVGENISYFSQDARLVIFWMLVDDGNPKRGHRNNILSNAYKFIGLANGPSKEFGRVCVMVFADQTAPEGNNKKPVPIKL